MPAGRRSGTAYGLLALIVVFGLALRVCGLAWSLPDSSHPLATYHPDELINLNAATAVDISHGKLDTGFYNYGTFYFYLVSLAQTVGRGYHWIPTMPPSQAVPASDVELLRLQAPEQAALFFTGRIVTAAMGTATIPVVFFLGARLFGRRVGLLAALLYAMAPLAVLHAHFLTVDVPATFFVSLVLLWASRLVNEASWKNVVVSGVWCGLATATKYTAVVAVVAPLAALVLQARRISEPVDRTVWRDAGLHVGAMLLIAALVFLAACPGPLLNWNVFWNGTYPGSGIRYELFEHARSGHGYLFVRTGFGWWYHLTVSLRYGLGLPLLLLAGAGVVFAIRRRSPADLLLLSFLLIGYAASSLSAVRFARYLIPLYPALCVLAARVVFVIFTQSVWRRATLAAGGIVCLFTATYSIALVRAMTVPDPRDRAADALRAMAKPGQTLAFAHIPWFYSPPLSSLWGAPSFKVRGHATDDTAGLQFRMPANDWDMSVLTPPPDYVVLSSFELQQEWRRLHLPPATAFMNALETRYRATIFAPEPVPGLSPNDPNAPEDLMYVLPTVYLYTPRGSLTLTAIGKVQ